MHYLGHGRSSIKPRMLIPYLKPISSRPANLRNRTFRNGTVQPGWSISPPSYGMIIYHPAGYMSANIQTIKTSAGVVTSNTSLSYAGPYSLTYGNETSGALIHGPLSFATSSGWLHSPQRRNYTFFDDEKVLRLQARNKEDTTATLFWRKEGPSWDSERQSSKGI